MACLLLAGGLVHAQDAAVEEVREALRATRQPWYDADKDGVRQLMTDADAQTPPTRADWQIRRGTPWEWNWQGGGNWSWLGEFMKYLAWGVLIALLGFLIYALGQAYFNANPIRSPQPLNGLPAQDRLTEEERMENLPVRLETKGDFLNVAASLYQEGRFGEAMVYLFSYRLIQLDRYGCIRLTKGKTNRQYLREVRHHVDLQQILGQTIVPFEDFFFGEHPLSQERFERCWNQNDRFSQRLQEVGA